MLITLSLDSKEASLCPAWHYNLKPEVKLTSHFWVTFSPLSVRSSLTCFSTHYPYSFPQSSSFLWPINLNRNGVNPSNIQRFSPQGNAWARVDLRNPLHRLSSNSMAPNKIGRTNHPRCSSASYKTDELMPQVYISSCRADILGRPNLLIMTPGIDRTSTPRKKPKLMTWLQDKIHSP